MKMKLSLIAKWKLVLCGALLVLGAIAVFPGDVVQAQEADGTVQQPPPGMQPGSDFWPGGRRQEMRKMFREEMRERFQNGKQRGEDFGAPGASGGPGCTGGPGCSGDGPGRGGQGRIGRFLEVVQSYQAAVQDSYQAVGLAALGIKDHYRRSGKPQDAVHELQEMLAQTSDQKMRNIFLFVIKQIYEEERQTDKFLEVSRQIVKENISNKSK